VTNETPSPEKIKENTVVENSVKHPHLNYSSK
jgi:hypothetical protein